MELWLFCDITVISHTEAFYIVIKYEFVNLFGRSTLAHTNFYDSWIRQAEKQKIYKDTNIKNHFFTN